MKQISEQDFDTLEEFFDYCSEKISQEINWKTLNTKFKSKWNKYQQAEVITISNKYSITFDSGGYTLIIE